MKASLEHFSAELRLEICKMLKARGFGHLGGSMSIVETLAVLYGREMRHNPEDPSWEGRDFFVLSKGHAGPAYYAALALSGYFDTEMLATLNANGTRLPSHPDRLKTPGIDATTGSLGQGISVAVGMAKALKMDGKPNRVYCLVGDGECNEGQVWEALQFAAHQGLDNFILFIDENKKQLDGMTERIMKPFDLREKTEAFGACSVRVDGSDVHAIYRGLQDCKERPGVPGCIVLDTVKGQGLPYFEQLADNHHIRFSGETAEALDAAIETLTACVARFNEGGGNDSTHN